MHFSLSDPSYVTEIAYSKDTPTQESLVFDAVVASPYKLIAAGHGLLQFGSVVFHRMHHNQEPNAQFIYLEPQPDDERSKAGTFHCGYSSIMLEIRKTDTYAQWMDSLRDLQARARIQVRIERLAAGNPGDVKAVGDGVPELRIDYGPGYRVGNPPIFSSPRKWS